MKPHYMNKELKPCPFCGGDAKIYKVPGAKHKIDRTGAILPALMVACENIDCSANMGNYHNVADIIEAWNRRPTTPQG